MKIESVIEKNVVHSLPCPYLPDAECLGVMTSSVPTAKTK